MIKGSLVALVTPFKNGQLDLDTLKDLIEWHIDSGTHGFVPVGTTGESPTLTHAEHETVVEEVVRIVAGRRPVIAGAGSNNTAESIRLIQHAEKVGADAALVVTPYYNKPTQAGLIAHFTALHDCCTLPIIIYNIPRPLGRRHDARHDGRTGETAADRRRQGRHRRPVPRPRNSASPAAPISSSCRARTPRALGFNAHGGVGCISVTANVAPQLCAEFQEATLAGDYAKALAISGPADAAARRDLHRTRPCRREIRHVAARQMQRTRCACPLPASPMAPRPEFATRWSMPAC